MGGTGVTGGVGATDAAGEGGAKMGSLSGDGLRDWIGVTRIGWGGGTGAGRPGR